MKREELGNIISWVDQVRNWVAFNGYFIFGGLGFIFGDLSFVYIISEKGQEVPNFVFYLFSIFGYWLGLIFTLAIAQMILSAIYFNKRNWGKRK